MSVDMPRPVFIIAEAGVNHNGKLALARRLVDVAARAGADAVKFQVFQTQLLVTRTAPRAGYQARNAPGNETQHDMLKRLELSSRALHLIRAHCARRRVRFLATPFDEPSLDLLVNALKVEALKISSGDLTNGPLLLRAAHSGRPLFLSTGMSTLGEVEEALGILAFGYVNSIARPGRGAFRRAFRSSSGQEALRNRVVLLQCTSEYPAPFAETNLRAMETMRDAFGLSVGFSDHTEGIEVALAAAAMGAVVIEKHFTLDRAMAGPDHAASVEPEELTAMVRALRNVGQALGSRDKRMTMSERDTATIARKSLVASEAIARGQRFTARNLGVKRPGTGVPPCQYWDYLGRKARRDYAVDDLIEPFI